MQPKDFWECTLYDIAIFIIANLKKEERRRKEINEIVYTLSYVNARFSAVNLHNALTPSKGKSINYPSFDDLFNNELNESKNKNNFDKIDENNKNEFYRKQIEAYRKMGMSGY